MKKQIAAITLSVAIVIGNPITFAEASNDLENIRTERESIQKDLTEAEQEIADTVKEIESIQSKIETANVQLQEKQALVEETDENIETTIEELKKLQEEIAQLKTGIEERFGLLKKRVSSYQENGGSISYIEVVFGAETFGDFISRISSVNKIMDSDVALMEQLEEDMKKIEENEKLSLDKLDELNALKEEQEVKIAQIEEQKSESEKAQQALEEKHVELADLTKDLKLEDSNLAQAEDEVKEQIALAQKKAEQKEKATTNVTKNKSENQSTEDQSQAKKEAPKSVQTASSEAQPKSENKTASKQQDNQKSFTVTATAYTVESAGGSGITATGINLKSNPDKKVIAVDPSVIPLGSVVYVEGYGYAIAGDTGGAIKGKKIDVHVPTAEAAKNWGVRTVNVTIQ